MSKTPNFDSKVKAILDATKSGERTCALTGEKWMMTDEEIGWYKKFNVPPSTCSPLARIKNVTGFGYGVNFWWQKHAKTGKPIITYVHPATGLKVVTDAEFFQEDHTLFAPTHDPSRPFFEQMRALQLQVPYPAQRNVVPPENSLTIASFGDVNSYFMIGCQSKNSLFSMVSDGVENSMEVLHSKNVSDSYHVANSHAIFNCQVVYQSAECLKSAFVFDCKDCENCFGVWNKAHVKYQWWNEQLSKEEWMKRRGEVALNRRSIFQEQIARFKDVLSTQAIWPENFNINAENCLGEFLYNCRDCRYIYMGSNGPVDNFWGVYFSGQSERNAFLGGSSDSQDNYTCHAPYRSRGCRFGHSVINSQNLEYCIQCYDCEHCFACVGLTRKRFCLFNKQLSEDAYWQAVDALKCHLLETGEYGQFFPLSMSPSYPPLATNMVYLTTNEEQKQLGAQLFDPDADHAFGEGLEGSETQTVESVPDDIAQTGADEWSKKILMDPDEKRRFALLSPEIALCQKLGIALLPSHPVARMRRLMLSVNSAVFDELFCMKCGKGIHVARNVTFPRRIVYCRSCYLEYLEKSG